MGQSGQVFLRVIHSTVNLIAYMRHTHI